jgi:hypothetical protein
MKHYLPHSALLLLWFVGTNLYQSFQHLGDDYIWTPKLAVYVVVHALLMVACAIILLRESRRPANLFARIKAQLSALPMPRVAKIVVGVILLVQLGHITLGVTNYPFADVGMFRWAKEQRELPAELTLPKYYYTDANGAVYPVEIRKQHIWAAADLLGWGYNNEYTFSATYHYKAEKANFDLLSEAIRSKAGIDTLWVGLQTVDFATGTVSFDPDRERAILFNDTARIHYGKLFVPHYQRRSRNHHDAAE